MTQLNHGAIAEKYNDAPHYYMRPRICWVIEHFNDFLVYLQEILCRGDHTDLEVWYNDFDEPSQYFDNTNIPAPELPAIVRVNWYQEYAYDGSMRSILRGDIIATPFGDPSNHPIR